MAARWGAPWLTNNQQMFRPFGLLEKKRVRVATLHSAVPFFGSSPKMACALPQADLTYLHFAGHGCRHAVAMVNSG